MKTLGDTEKNGRGFDTIKFEDANGNSCSIQCSSAIGDYDNSFEVPGSSFLWIGVNNANPKILAVDAARLGLNPTQFVGWVDYKIPDEVLLTTRMHLNREQVKALRTHLGKWLKEHKL